MTEEISYPVINKEICKGCMRCIVGCPQNATAMDVQDVRTATLHALNHWRWKYISIKR